MEDLVGYKVLQLGLAAGHSDLVAIERLARVLGKIHQATHVSVMSKPDFQELTETFQ